MIKYVSFLTYSYIGDGGPCAFIFANGAVQTSQHLFLENPDDPKGHSLDIGKSPLKKQVPNNWESPPGYQISSPP